MRVLLRSLPTLVPFRLSPRPDGVRLGVLDLEAERGEMVRRGGDLVLERVCDLANAEVCWRDRVRPRSGEEEGMVLEISPIQRVCYRKTYNVKVHSYVNCFRLWNDWPDLGLCLKQQKS